MINFVNFMAFSSLEFLSIIILMLTLFQFKIKYFIVETISTSILMTLISYLLVIFEVSSSLLVILQIISLVLLFKFIFKEHKWKYCILVVTLSYIFFVGIQSGLIGLFVYAKYFTMQDLTNVFAVKTYTFQTIEFIFCLFLSASFKIFKQQGFAFQANSKVKKLNHFIGAVIMCAILSSALLFGFNQSVNLQYFIVVLVGLFIITLLLLYLSIKRNEAEYAPEVYGLKKDKKEVERI